MQNAAPEKVRQKLLYGPFSPTGLLASTIDLGIVADVGIVTRSDSQYRAQISAFAHDVFEERKLHAILKRAILNNPTK